MDMPETTAEMDRPGEPRIGQSADRWMTMADVIAHTRKSRSTIDRAIAAGLLLRSQTGGPRGRLHFKLADVEAWMRGVKPAAHYRRGPRRRTA